MCQRAIGLISNALHEVANAEALLKIKGVIALFMQTMDVGAHAAPGSVTFVGLLLIVMGLPNWCTRLLLAGTVPKICRAVEDKV
jgi:hypothetical protein